jgi:hypothetical protein
VSPSPKKISEANSLTLVYDFLLLGMQNGCAGRFPKIPQQHDRRKRHKKGK